MSMQSIDFTTPGMEVLYEQFHTANTIGTTLFIYLVRECPVHPKYRICAL
ncbi:MAG: hypothetical protein QF568_03960 [Flavobacteriales bacterium]|nr:hypothetical protein [Flavobacteriales bacterium]